MNILYFLRDDGACGFYRVAQPLQKLATLSPGKHKVEEFRQGSANLSKLDEMIEKAHIIVIPRLAEEKFILLCKEMSKVGKKIVIDHDDNMFEISPLSPHYDCCGVEDVKVMLGDGTIMELWTDGKNLDIKRNLAIREGFKEALKIADLVTTTQPHLADVYREFNPNVACLPNCVDLWAWNKDIKVCKDEFIRMGWSGGHSHYEDWCLLSKVLPVVMDKYKNLKLVIVGTKFDGTLKNVADKSRIEFHSWVPTPAHPYKQTLINLDFSIIPLAETKFNICKSPIKWVEQGALARPSVTSFVSPYKELDNGKNGIFIENNTTDGWIEGISYMVENESERVAMGLEAYKTVAENFDANKEWVQWEREYAKLLEK